MTRSFRAFYLCGGLTNATIGDGVIQLAYGAFGGCSSLKSLTIPDSVTDLGLWAFYGCISLTDVTIGRGVTSIGENTFGTCPSLTAIYFWGDAPSINLDFAFGANTNLTLYYLPGTAGWSGTYAGRPTAPWVLPRPVILSTAPNLGAQANQFGFRISWATNASVVIEASTNAGDPWVAVSTNALVNGWSDFSDAERTNYPMRFYRLRSL